MSTPEPSRPEPLGAEPDPHPERGGLIARGVSFWFDSLLLSLILIAVMWAFPVPDLTNQLGFMTALGIYRVIGEHFFGCTLAKKMSNLRVSYRDGLGRERAGADRLAFVIARNSWLLVAGLVWFWAPDADLGWLIFVQFISLLFTNFHATIMDLVARARVLNDPFV